jgi:hypothetical protein
MAAVLSLLQPQRQRMLEELKVLSQSMLEQAGAGDWEAVAAVRTGFEERLRKLCAEPLVAAEALPLMQGLKALQEQLFRLETLAQCRHAELRLHLQRMHRHRQAVQIYHAAQGGHGEGG